MDILKESCWSFHRQNSVGPFKRAMNKLDKAYSRNKTKLSRGLVIFEKLCKKLEKVSQPQATKDVQAKVNFMLDQG